MKARTLKQLNKLHLYSHKRFHSTDGKYLLHWLGIRTAIIKLIIERGTKW